MTSAPENAMPRRILERQLHDPDGDRESQHVETNSERDTKYL
ncbi:MAG TPA: hypothetical protein VIK27_07365 [Candidatus Aquilonibacter sp.]